MLSGSAPLSHVAAVNGDAVLVPLKALVQHICTKTPDRAEYRSKIAVVSCTVCTPVLYKPSIIRIIQTLYYTNPVLYKPCIL